MAPAGDPKIANTFESLLLNYSIMQHIAHNWASATYNFRAGPSTNSHHHGNKEISTSERENIFLMLDNLRRCAYLSSAAFQPSTYCWSNWDFPTIKSMVFHLKLGTFLWIRISDWIKIPIFVPAIGNIALQINLRFGFKRKKEGPKSFDLIDLEKTNIL